MSRPEIPTFQADRRATTSLEFAFVMTALLMSIFFILNVGLHLFLQTTLDTATASAARQVRLGLQTTDAGIRSAICGQLSGLITSPCTGLKIYVASASAFSGITPATVSGGTLSKTGVSPGAMGNAVLMQVAYQAISSAQFMPINLTILSSVTFVNEP